MPRTREKNSLKNAIIKISSASQGGFQECLPQQCLLKKPYEAYYDSNVPFTDSKKTAKCYKKKDTPQTFIIKSFFKFGVLIMI